MRKEVIGNATLYLGDCLTILPELRADAIITDPPYGQRQNTNVVGKGGSRAYSIHDKRRKAAGGLHSTGIATRFPDAIAVDDKPFDPAPWLALAPVVLFWGAHKFAHRLPAGGWLVWDKVPTGKIRDQGDGEAAWLNRDRPMRIYRLLWDGVCVGTEARHEVTAGQQRVHPTQKPEALMRWCITQAGAAGTILDPYMGAGSTGVAALQLGHKFVGVEIEPQYFEVACERIENVQRQERLFA